RLTQHKERRDGLSDEVAIGRSEIGNIEQEIQSLDQSSMTASQQAETAEEQAQRLQAGLRNAECEIKEQERQRHRLLETLTTSKVALAQVEERIAAFQGKQGQVDIDLAQRRQEQRQCDEQVSSARNRIIEGQLAMLRASERLAQACAIKEKAELSLIKLVQERQALRHERRELGGRAQAAQNAWRAQQDQAHARELVVNDMTHARDTLVERLREDYQIDLTDLYRQVQVGACPAPVPVEATTVNEEIAELRRKLARLGSVNLD